MLSGGRSTEHEVSLSSGASVVKGLEEAGHEVVAVLIGRDGRWLAAGDAVELVPGGGLLGADVAFPVLHGAFGEDGSLQGLLEILDVPYVGADVLASAPCIDKLRLKRLLGRAGDPAGRLRRRRGSGLARKRCGELGPPLWVKPSRMGTSVGISRIGTSTRLDEAVQPALATTRE